MSGLAARDERETVVDNAADRLAYLVISFGLLALVAYRNFVHGEASWDLMGLVLVGGAVGTAYRAHQGALSRRWILVAGLSAAVAVVLAAITVLVARP